MTNTRKLWLIGALALLAACDPFESEKKGQLEILSAFGSTWASVTRSPLTSVPFREPRSRIINTPSASNTSQ